VTLAHIGQDVRHALRAIVRAPLVSAVIVLSLGLGIGVNTVVFSWIQARLLDPLPGVADGASFQLVEPRSVAGLYTGASWPEYRDLRHHLRSMPDLFASRMVPLYVGEAGQVERVFGLLVSDNYFSALGVRPVLGRFLRPEEVARAGSEPVAVISHGLWQARFAGTPDALGRTLRINALDLTVIGVTPQEFQGTVLGLNFDIWIPATLAPLVASGSRELDQRNVRGYSIMGRLAPSVTRQQAQGEIDIVMRQLAQSYPATNGGLGAEILPFWDSPRGPQRMLTSALLVLQGVMLLLLVVVCGNMANLVLARASARQKEIGARLALGAERRHVVSLVLAENLVLALLGAGLGAALAVWGTKGLLILPLTGLPVRFQTGIDGWGLAFATTLGIACGLAFGAIPAAHLARVNSLSALRAAGSTSSRSTLRTGLMGFQVALAVVVLIVAGLFFRSFMETRTTDPGFRRDGVLLAAYDLAGRRADAVFSRDLATRALARLRAIPGVAQAAIASSVPLDIHGMPTRVFTVDGHVRTDDGFDESLANTVTPSYFDVMGIALRSGTDFVDLNDTAAPAQAVVNEEFVRRFIPTGEPLGRGLTVRGRRLVICAVAADSLYDAFGEPPAPMIYISYRDFPQTRGEIHLQTAGLGATSVATEVRRAMREVDADLPVFNVRSMTDHVETNLIFRRIPARMFAVLGPLLLLLAAIGIYAVVAYAVSLRTTEIGVRLALGATPQRVVGQFVAEHIVVVACGAILGWLAAFVAAADLLDDRSLDVLVFAGSPAILLAVAAVACWLPAWRAARTAPIEALREG
jgi:predicted permease